MADAVTGDPSAGLLPGPPVAARFVSASRDINPATPAGVPMVAESRYQLYIPTALQTGGAMPEGFNGCEHWLWPAMPLAAIPRINGERIVLLGAQAFAMTWDVSRRFPALAGELRLLETLSPFRVAEQLERLTGRALPSQAAPVLSKAA